MTIKWKESIEPDQSFSIESLMHLTSILFPFQCRDFLKSAEMAQVSSYLIQTMEKVFKELKHEIIHKCF